MPKERFDQAKLINIANGLTALRIVLLPFFAYELISGRIRAALLVFVVCGASDLLDGLLARRLHQRTLIGAYLDPIADKLLMATSFIVLAIVGIAPTWLTVLVISRDIIILIGGVLYLLLLEDAEIAPTFASKVNTAVQVVTVCFFLAGNAFPWILPVATVETAERGMSYLCAATTTASGAQYLAIGLKRLAHG